MQQPYRYFGYRTDNRSSVWGVFAVKCLWHKGLRDFAVNETAKSLCPKGLPAYPQVIHNMRFLSQK